MRTKINSTSVSAVITNVYIGVPLFRQLRCSFFPAVTSRPIAPWQPLCRMLRPHNCESLGHHARIFAHPHCPFTCLMLVHQYDTRSQGKLSTRHEQNMKYMNSGRILAVWRNMLLGTCVPGAVQNRFRQTLGKIRRRAGITRSMKRLGFVFW